MLRLAGYDKNQQITQLIRFDYLRSCSGGLALYNTGESHPVAIIEEAFCGTCIRCYRILMYNFRETIDTRTERLVESWDIREMDE